ncbi:MAG TPA: FtsX-like permease family protein [Bdellovibrionota bacterium]|nr:FtsX-like permease family protein [Bdellovibrionota bacterium]
MLLWKLAFKNLFVHRLKTLVTGLIIVIGTTLAIVGNSVVDAVSGGMQNSLTNSITGDIQIYAADAKEPIAILGSTDGNLPDIGHLASFRAIKEKIAPLPNVKAVIPMGVSFAMQSPGNLLDIKLTEMRAAYAATPRDLARIAALKSHVRAIIDDIARSQEANRENLGGIYGGEEIFKNAPADLATAKSEAFWASFDANHESRIEFLANQMAPLIFDDNQLFLNYVGTVPDLFQQSFEQFEIAQGEMIPAGKRGFLFSDYVYENQIKHRVARRLDQIKKQIEKEKLTIAGSTDLKDRVKANQAQAAEIYNQIEPATLVAVADKLRALLGSTSQDVPELVSSFLDMNDESFMARYDFFYKEIAPHILLYKIKVGDTFAITGFTKSGYSSSVNMKVYGTYRFKSFESSPLAGTLNIMDMVSFRKLFGMVTSDMREEINALDAEMGLADVGRDDIESIFAGSARTDESKSSQTLKKLKNESFGQVDTERRDLDRVYSRSEMEDGVFMNAAVILKDSGDTDDTLELIRETGKKDGLGIQAADWREAAGVIGQMTIMVRGVLYLFVVIIFGVATFIIMNSMLMATLERRREIGTMRAIGAQRSFLMGLFLRETFVLSFIFGMVGTMIGVTIVSLVGARGIPAMGDVATFFFSGDRLYLHVNLLHIAVVFVCMTLVALVSTQYPAWRAMKISPLEAMQSSE